MRFFCGLMLLLTAATTLWAQREPCLAGIDSPDCGIKITFNPPVTLTEEKNLQVPNEITIEVPIRFHATKVQLKTGPAGGTTADQFKLFAETARFKKAGNVVRFQMELKDCPGSDNALVFDIVAPKFPYPIVVNYQPVECRKGESK